MNPLETPQITASQFPQVYEDLGIDPGKLGCVMLNTEPIQVGDIILYDDLYMADPEEHPHMQGIISETETHVTLLYGLLRSGTEMRKHVDAVLSGWSPESPTISEVSFFPSNDPSESYITLVHRGGNSSIVKRTA